MNQTNSHAYIAALKQAGASEQCFKPIGLIFGALSLFGLVVDEAHAKDTLAALMQRMQSNTAVKIAYRETRTLQLLDKPWQGSGYLYALPPDLMIKEQLLPQRELMGIKGEQIFYFDPGNAVHHQTEMDEDNPLTLNIAVFKALINADEALLHRLYRVEFASSAQVWAMTLKPRQDSQSGFKVVISGPPEQQADTIQVQQADGDLAGFSLQRVAPGEEINNNVERLYLELLGE